MNFLRVIFSLLLMTLIAPVYGQEVISSFSVDLGRGKDWNALPVNDETIKRKAVFLHKKGEELHGLALDEEYHNQLQAEITKPEGEVFYAALDAAATKSGYTLLFINKDLSRFARLSCNDRFSNTTSQVYALNLEDEEYLSVVHEGSVFYTLTYAKKEKNLVLYKFTDSDYERHVLNLQPPKRRRDKTLTGFYEEMRPLAINREVQWDHYFASRIPNFLFVENGKLYLISKRLNEMFSAIVDLTTFEVQENSLADLVDYDKDERYQKEMGKFQYRQSMLHRNYFLVIRTYKYGMVLTAKNIITKELLNELRWYAKDPEKSDIRPLVTYKKEEYYPEHEDYLKYSRLGLVNVNRGWNYFVSDYPAGMLNFSIESFGMTPGYNTDVGKYSFAQLEFSLSTQDMSFSPVYSFPPTKLIKLHHGRFNYKRLTGENVSTEIGMDEENNLMFGEYDASEKAYIIRMFVGSVNNTGLGKNTDR